MKHTWIILLLLTAGMVFSPDASAQKKKKKGKKSKKGGSSDSGSSDKKDKKIWAKKKKQMDPLKFRDMYNQYNALKSEGSKLNRQIKTLTKQIEDSESIVASKDDQIAALRTKIQETKRDCEEAASSSGGNNGGSRDITAGGDDYTKGIVYKVQVGAFRLKGLQVHLDKPSKFWEEDSDGTKKYTIGYFRDYWEADKFKKYLRAMGVKDAWIVAYEDNQRKDIKDVIDKDVLDSLENGNGGK